MDLVALSIVSPERLAELNATVGLLRSLNREVPLPIMVGGRGIAGVEDQVGGVYHAGALLADAEAFIEKIGAQLGLVGRR